MSFKINFIRKNMKKVLLTAFLFFTVMLIAAGVSYAAKIHLKNGSVIGCKIIAFDDTSVTVINQALDIRKISRERIIKIEPPLEKSEVLKEKTKAEIPKQEEQYYVDFAEREKKLLSFYFSGGLNYINGGDLNGVIKDYKQLIHDYNEYYSTEYSVPWKELKWVPNFKGEVLVNLSRSFSVSLGIEYLTKKSKGDNTFNDSFSGTTYETAFYYNYSLSDSYLEDPEYELTAIPVTFNIYYFKPINNKTEIFITAGVGYYFGKLKYNMPYQSDTEYQEDYYANDGTFMYSWTDDYSYSGTEVYEVKCNEIGFHGSVGADYKLISILSADKKPFSTISLVAECSYRYVIFKDWNGNWSDNWSWNETWGWSDIGLSEDSGSVSDSWSGKIWYYEYEDPDLEKQYKRMSLYKEQPESGQGISNIRQAKINLNGFSFRIGIKISF